MKNVSVYQLIAGNFEKDEAKSLLTDLFASKIKYHSLCAWRYEESKGEKSEYHEAKIQELRKERDRLLVEMESLDINQIIQINSKVECVFIHEN
jgi:hypothetical protein